jgi:hypothetical protein
MVAIRPRRDRTIIIPPVTSHTNVSKIDPNSGTEFGGVAGMIQPDPHTLTPAETISEIYAIDPTDAGPGSAPGAMSPPAF